MKFARAPLILVLMVAAGAFFFSKNDPARSIVLQPTPAVSIAVPNQKLPNVREAAQVEALYFPSADVYRAQVSKNPHGMPLVLAEFSQRVSSRMLRALKSENEAMSLTREFESCAKNESREMLPQVRAICTINAQRLENQYPQKLEGTGERLRSALSADALTLVRAISN